MADVNVVAPMDEEDAFYSGGDGEEGGSQPAAEAATATKEASCKFPCLKCKKNVAKGGVRCNTCYIWVHIKCQKITKDVYAVLTNPTKYGGICWNCESCLAGATRLQAKMEALEARFHEVEGRVIRNEGAVMDVEKRVDKVEKRQDKVEDIVAKERELQRKERVTEMRERETRKKNIILHRVEEAGQRATNLDERKEWDLRSCENIFMALKLPIDRRNIKFTRRIGEQSEEPRPLMIGLTRENMKEDILESASELRNTPFNTVGIVPDLTQEQRKDETEMIQEAARRNGELTEEDKAKNLEWAVVGRKGEKRLVKGKVRERVEGSTWRGGRGGRGRGVGSAPQRATTTQPLLPANDPRNNNWAPVRGGRGEDRERENLIELVRGGMTGVRPRVNSKRGREGEETEEDSRGPPPPQPTAAAVP